MTGFKKFLLGLGAVLGIGAGVAVMVPGGGAAFAPLLKTAGELVTQHASGMLDACDDRTCARDPKTGEAGMKGPIALLDGGTCLCE